MSLPLQDISLFDASTKKQPQQQKWVFLSSCLGDLFLQTTKPTQTHSFRKGELLFIFTQQPATVKLHFKIILFPDDAGEAVCLLPCIGPIAKCVVQVSKSAA